MADQLEAHPGIGYLRLSVTKRCGLRCVYCRPEGAARKEPGPVLTADEIDTLVRHLSYRHGLSKVRITGGEPTLRSDLLEIVRRISAIPGIDDLGLTTSGANLARLAPALADAGLPRVNISLDTLEPAAFERITGVPALHRVRAGIDAAIDAGLTPLKLNTVVLRGENVEELPDLLCFAVERDAEIRFIELMPMGPLASRWAERYVPVSEMRERLAPLVRQWTPLDRGRGSARSFCVTLMDGRRGRVGFIGPMSSPFCGVCHRIRIAADGGFFPCLMDRPRGSVLSALRPQFDPDALDAVLRDGLSAKAPVHPVCGHGLMTHIGG